MGSGARVDEGAHVNDSLAIPSQLADADISEAVRLVREYYDIADPSAFYTGALYDGLGGGGDLAGQRNRFTGADIMAVSMLSVRILPSSRAALSSAAPRIAELLADVPHDMHLADPAAARYLEPTEAAWHLWDLLVGIPGIKWVTASKLLARKRPLLIPVYDNVVRQVLGRDDYAIWHPLHTALSADDQHLHRRLLAIREAAGLGDGISPLRIFDVVCWRVGKQRGLSDPDADAKLPEDA